MTGKALSRDGRQTSMVSQVKVVQTRHLKQKFSRLRHVFIQFEVEDRLELKVPALQYRRLQECT